MRGVIAIVVCFGFFLLAAPTNAQARQAVCSVERGYELKSRKLCRFEQTRETGCEEGCKVVRRFIWPDGDQTVVASVEEFFTLNGREVERDHWSVNADRWCFKNVRSGNTFCYAEFK